MSSRARSTTARWSAGSARESMRAAHRGRSMVRSTVPTTRFVGATYRCLLAGVHRYSREHLQPEVESIDWTFTEESGKNGVEVVMRTSSSGVVVARRGP